VDTQVKNLAEISPEELLDRAIAMQATLRERAKHTRELRRVPDETMAELIAAGFFKMMQPKRYGGYEMNPKHFYDVVFEIARACPSTGWVLSVVGVHNWQLALLDDRAQQDVWGEDNTKLISSSYAPKGKAEASEGGYKFSGQWQFSSGCDHCDWIFVGGLLPENPDMPGVPQLGSFLIPSSDYEIIDDWHTTGLQGSGSKTLVVKDAFVPSYRVHSFMQGFLCQSPGQAVNTSPIYKLPFGQVFIRAVSTPSIGTAQGALDAYCEYNAKRLNSVGQKVVDSPAGQIAGAKTLSAIRTARLKLHNAFDTLLEYAENDKPYRDIDRVEFRYDSCNTVETLVPLVQELLANSGGTAIYQGNTVNELFQDILAFRQHAANQPYTPTINLGAVMFGAPLQDMFC
jgi:3-hydroxy-9,10-secoandrosta-1,3,5(10)-triene-9,17-dione monooxygenase